MSHVRHVSAVRCADPFWYIATWSAVHLIPEPDLLAFLQAARNAHNRHWRSNLEGWLAKSWERQNYKLQVIHEAKSKSRLVLSVLGTSKLSVSRFSSNDCGASWESHAVMKCQLPYHEILDSTCCSSSVWHFGVELTLIKALGHLIKRVSWSKISWISHNPVRPVFQ